MIKEVRFSSVDSAVEFINVCRDDEGAKIDSIECGAGGVSETKIILCFPPSKVSRVMKTVTVTMPYTPIYNAIEMLYEPPAL